MLPAQRFDTQSCYYPLMVLFAQRVSCLRAARVQPPLRCHRYADILHHQSPMPSYTRSPPSCYALLASHALVEATIIDADYIAAFD